MNSTTEKKSTKPNRGQFQKGHDPRRHVFTPEECERGFWAAIDSVIARHPNAITRDGRHIACNLLPAMNTRRMLRGS